jgi:hypothetical protein
VAARDDLTDSFMDWRNDYRLLLANEEGAPRAWLGAYHLIAIYGRALTAAEIALNFRAGPDP